MIKIKNICHVSRLFHSELYSSAPRSLERDIVQKSKPNRAPWPLQILQVKRNEATVRLSHIDSDVRDEHGGRLEPVAESSIFTRVLLDFGKMSSVVAWSRVASDLGLKSGVSNPIKVKCLYLPDKGVVCSKLDSHCLHDAISYRFIAV